MSENLKRAESLFNRIMNQNLYKSASLGHQNSHSSHHKYKKGAQHQAPAASVELPKRDPVKESHETVSRIPADHHILPYCWTIWHHSRQKVKKREDEVEEAPATATAVDLYLQTTREVRFPSVAADSAVSSIGSVEQLWLSLLWIKKTFELPIGTEILLFKLGINPVWEDPINLKGGRWVFRFNRRVTPSVGVSDVSSEQVLRLRQRLALIWERLLLKTITGLIIPDSNYGEEVQELLLNDICGLVLSVRKDEDIISVWNSNLSFGKKRLDDDKAKKVLTSFQARRIICDLILRIIRECDLISQGLDCVETLDTGSSERVHGVSFEYRLHADNNPPLAVGGASGDGATTKYRRYAKHHHHRLSEES